MHLTHSPETPPADPIDFATFLMADIRAGTVACAEAFDKARKPAFILHIDFGDAIGVKKTSAQITANYTLEDLPGRQVAAVVNFPARQIGPIISEVLTLGFADEAGEVVLFAPDRPVPNGSRLF